MANTPESTVGNPVMDAQHEAVFARFADVRRRLDEEDAAGTATALDAVWDAVVTHFAAEDSMMDAHGYPERVAHRAAHNLFMQDLQHVRAQLQQAGLTDEVASSAGHRLPEWFTFHIQTNDVPLARYVARQHAARIVAAARGELPPLPKPSDA